MICSSKQIYFPTGYFYRRGLCRSPVADLVMNEDFVVSFLLLLQSWPYKMFKWVKDL